MGSRITITPHSSHRMGIVEGETRCTECWSAPDWPIIEKHCGDESRHDHAERDALVFAAYREGTGIKVIAAEMHLARETVTRIIARHATPVEREKRGRGPAIKVSEIEQAIALRDEGVPWVQIGAQMGRKWGSLKSAVGEYRRAEQRRKA